jgi:predicted protein tyrosine phosphatase
VEFQPAALVTAFGPERRVRLLEDRPHLHLPFHDISVASHPQWVRMSGAQMSTFIRFLDVIGRCRLLICCYRGKARSTALSLIASQHWSIAYELPAHAVPNPWVLKLGAFRRGC